MNKNDVSKNNFYSLGKGQPTENTLQVLLNAVCYIRIYLTAKIISPLLTWLQRRSWPQDEEVHQLWSFPTCPAQEDHWCGRRCRKHWGRDSSWPRHHLLTGAWKGNSLCGPHSLKSGDFQCSGFFCLWVFSSAKNDEALFTTLFTECNPN